MATDPSQVQNQPEKAPERFRDVFREYITAIRRKASNSILYRFALIFVCISLVMVLTGLYFKSFSSSSILDLMISAGANIFNSCIFLITFDIALFNTERNKVDYKNGLDIKKFIDLARKSEREINCMTTYFGPITTMERPEVQEEVRVTIREILSRPRMDKNGNKFSVRIMMLYPLSAAASQRQRDLHGRNRNIGRPDDDTINRINESAFELFELKHCNSNFRTFNRLKLGIFDSLPPCFHLQCDNDISIIHYLPEVSIRHGLRMDCKAGSKYAILYEKALEDIWNSCSSELYAHMERVCHIRLNLYIKNTSSGEYRASYTEKRVDDQRIVLFFDTSRAYHDDLFNLIKANHSINKPLVMDIGTSEYHSGYQYKVSAINAKSLKNTAEFDKAKDKYNIVFNKMVTIRKCEENELIESNDFVSE